ncbi:hypothetical protein ACEA83_23810, partial [Escherichia coli]
MRLFRVMGWVPGFAFITSERNFVESDSHASAQLLVLDLLERKSYLKERATWARVGGARKAPLGGG